MKQGDDAASPILTLHSNRPETVPTHWKGTTSDSDQIHRVSVEDQRVERIAVATAVSDWRGPGEEWAVREAEVTIETMWWGSGSEERPTSESPAFVTIKCLTSGFNLPIPYERREHAISNEDLQLGDLPLLVLALQDAIRVGIEQGSLPDLSKTV